MISRLGLRQHVKDWIHARKGRGLEDGQIASFVCDLFSEYVGEVLAEKNRIEELRREDILAFISKESKLLEDRDALNDRVDELQGKLEEILAENREYHKKILQQRDKIQKVEYFVKDLLMSGMKEMITKVYNELWVIEQFNSLDEAECTCGADDSPNIGFGDCGCKVHDK